MEDSGCDKTTALSLSLMAGVVFAAFAAASLFWWTRRLHHRREHRAMLRDPAQRRRLKPRSAYNVSQLAVALGVMSVALSLAAAVAWWQIRNGPACLAT